MLRPWGHQGDVMALDVWVGFPERGKGRLALSFESDAYFEFLMPQFDSFFEHYGIRIDPYDGASIEGEQLDAMLELLAAATTLIEQQSGRFDVYMGTDLGSHREPRNEKVYRTVERAEFLAFMAEFRGAAVEARRSDQLLYFIGD